jgi:hypothetical protein
MSNDNNASYFLQDLDLSKLNSTNDDIDISDIDLGTKAAESNLLKNLDNMNQNNNNKDGAMVELLHTVYKFIEEWDHSIITITKVLLFY